MDKLSEQRCAKCDRSRAAGWILVAGLCASCGPEQVEQRRQVLKAQARALLGESA